MKVLIEHLMLIWIFAPTSLVTIIFFLQALEIVVVFTHKGEGYVVIVIGPKRSDQKIEFSQVDLNRRTLMQP